jgi:hypothetical protein
MKSCEHALLIAAVQNTIFAVYSQHGQYAGVTTERRSPGTALLYGEYLLAVSLRKPNRKEPTQHQYYEVQTRIKLTWTVSGIFIS